MVICFCLSLSTNVVAQADAVDVEQTTQFDKEKWEELRSKEDYFRGKRLKENKSEDKKNKKSKSPKTFKEVNLKVFQYLMIGVAIGILVYVLLRVFASELFLSAKKSKVKLSYNINDVENNLENAPLKNMIAEAIAARQFKVAIRLYYLLILKELDTQKAIKWHKEKTNTQYLNEMRTNKSFNQFKLVTRLFEFVWYGNQDEISAAEFEQIEPTFKNFLNQIR